MVTSARRQTLDRVPGQPVGILRLVAALVAVGPNGLAGCRIKVGEEPADEVIGNLIGQIPPPLRLDDFGRKLVIILFLKMLSIYI